jgi:hypothetical protein
MKIPRGEGSEDTCISKTDNAMANRNRTKGQTIADKTLHRKLIFLKLSNVNSLKNKQRNLYAKKHTIQLIVS